MLQESRGSKALVELEERQRKRRKRNVRRTRISPHAANVIRCAWKGRRSPSAASSNVPATVYALSSREDVGRVTGSTGGVANRRIAATASAERRLDGSVVADIDLESNKNQEEETKERGNNTHPGSVARRVFEHANSLGQGCSVCADDQKVG
jgi:hypothetical protein